jgi:hypothetical protein
MASQISVQSREQLDREYEQTKARLARIEMLRADLDALPVQGEQD